MTTIAVLPSTEGEPGYRAVADGTEATGRTVGQAVDALVGLTGQPAGTTLIIVQPPGPDEFFTADQQRRLGELMARWRQARDSRTPFPADEQAELNALVEAELCGAAARAAAALRALSP
jgi:hypothetical protein